ncbi:MAG: hypothetical protein COB36_12330 [Alphaproteobacteria bacterium]|nr:MAG: hypothetical protein COB36_12330 [Alphaproteobacteria bacterium]
MWKSVTLATTTGGSGSRTVTCTISSPTGTGTNGGSLIPGEDIGTGTAIVPTNGIIYFDATLGDDADDGSIGSPKQTLDVLQALLQTAEPGDAFLFKRGERFFTTSSTYPFSTLGGGTSVKPITIGPYGTYTDNDPVFDKDISIDTLPIFRFLNVANSLDYLTIRDIDFTNTTGSGDRSDVAFQIGDDNQVDIVTGYRVERVTVADQRSGVKIDRCVDLVYQFNHVHDCYGIPAGGASEAGHTHGMYAHKCDNMYMEYNHHHDNGKVSSPHDWQLYISHSLNSKVRYNYLHDGPNIDKFRGDVGLEFRGNIMTGGVVSSGGGGGDSSPGEYAVSSDIIYAQNYKHGERLLFTVGEGSGLGTYDPGEMMDGCDVYSNIFHVEGVYPWLGVVTFYDNSPQGVRIYNNLIISDSINNVINADKDDYVLHSIKNNVIVRSGGFGGGAGDTLLWASADAADALNLDYNLYYDAEDAYTVQVIGVSNFTSLDDFRGTYAAQDVNSLETNPLITDIPGYDYSYGHLSLIYENGEDLRAYAPVDYYGNVHQLPMNIGHLAGEKPPTEEIQMDGLVVETGPDWDATSWPSGTVVDVNFTVSEDNAPMGSKTKDIELTVT